MDSNSEDKIWKKAKSVGSNNNKINKGSDKGHKSRNESGMEVSNEDEEEGGDDEEEEGSNNEKGGDEDDE